MIETDKILSEEEFGKRLSAIRNTKNGIEAKESHRQLTALCREQQKAIEDLQPLAICYAAHYASELGTERHPVHAEILEQAEELLAAFPESLKEKNEA